MFRLMVPLLLLGIACLTASCEDKAGSATSPPAPVSEGANTNRQYYQAKGVVQEVKPETKSVVIKHEEVPNYMAAMTMPFDVKTVDELRGLQAGDAVSFRIVVAGDDAWIDEIKKLNTPPKLSELPQNGQFRFTRDVEPLKIGDPLPEYHFTNELGQAVSTSQFKGQAIAFTFFFIRCPYPTFCPLMSRNFNDTERKLLAMTNGPTNWHLLSISFDPEFDSPAALKAYSHQYDCDPKHWDFVTSDLVEVTALADQVGENFWHEGPSITHNLRTVVVDANGRIQKIIPENKWTSDELVAEIVKAAAAKP